MLVMSGAGGKTHSVVTDRPAEERKGRDERQEKIDGNRIYDIDVYLYIGSIFI